MQQPTSSTTTARKHSHVEICLHREVRFDRKSTGFEAFSFEHNAAPEIDAAEIDLSTTFLGRNIGMPFMISSMTGGYGDAVELNRHLAETAARFSIPLGVGSMRQALEEGAHRESFAVVRKAAPDVPVYANIGAPEVAAGLSRQQLSTMIDLVEADALIVHLNPAQELFQPEGSTAFRGFLDRLNDLTAMLDIPVIAKEVGCGISARVARKLADAGVRAVDVAGAGGISWQKVEECRYLDRFGDEKRFSPTALPELLDWGIPTARCLEQIRDLRHSDSRYASLSLIASGGIRNGIDIAKSLALGANIAAAAGAMLSTLHEGKLDETIRTWANDLKAVMFLTGSPTVEALRNSPLYTINEHSSS